jgi:predicted peptidase
MRDFGGIELIREWASRCVFAAVCALSAPAANAIELDALSKYWTADASHVPYRAIETPGRVGGERVPLIVFLHGDYQDGTNNETQLGGYGNGSLELVDAAIRNHVPLVYIAPETTNAYWPPPRVAAVIADALKQFPDVDARRIYLTGISDGGTGVWDALKTWPRCFAAAVPMSGMTELSGLASITAVPEWVFHGAKDNDTNVETGYGGAMVGSRAVVRELRALGGTPKYTEYADEMHVIWQHAYGTRELLPWMLDQKLPRNACDFSALPPAGRLAR